MISGSYRYLALEHVHFGRPAAEVIAEEVARRRARRVMVVASRTLNQGSDVVRNAVSAIAQQVVEEFDACMEHTPRESVLALCARLRAMDADLVVTIGGGTAIDTVKVALICMAEHIDTVEGMDRCHVRLDEQGRRQVPVIGDPPLRQIAVPTTLSAAEFSDLAGCTDRRTGEKHHFTAPRIGPAAVILDPRATLHTPARLWLSTGIRAIDHAVESLCSTQAQPLTDATALHGLTLLSRSLRRYAEDPHDLCARLDAQMGAWLAATGVNRVSFGASHGIGHVLGSALGVPHGITSCVLLPTVLAYNAPAVGTRARELAKALGDGDRDPSDQLSALIRALGLPTRLREVGVEPAHFGGLAVKAMKNPFVRANPRRIDTPSQVEEILRLAW
jgi:maleylacetate reductase